MLLKLMSSPELWRWSEQKNEVREVGGENFGAEKRAEKSLGRGRGCVFRSSPEQPHPELVHWWLLVHSSPHCQGLTECKSMRLQKNTPVL
jgi:hypothetical protein